MNLSLLSRARVSSSPGDRTSGEDCLPFEPRFPAIRAFGVGRCVFHSSISQRLFLIPYHRLKDALAVHSRLTLSTMPWSLTILSTGKEGQVLYFFPLTFPPLWCRHRMVAMDFCPTRVSLLPHSSRHLDLPCIPDTPRNIS